MRPSYATPGPTRAPGSFGTPWAVHDVECGQQRTLNRILDDVRDAADRPCASKRRPADHTRAWKSARPSPERRSRRRRPSSVVLVKGAADLTLTTCDGPRIGHTRTLRVATIDLAVSRRTGRCDVRSRPPTPEGDWCDGPQAPIAPVRPGERLAGLLKGRGCSAKSAHRDGCVRGEAPPAHVGGRRTRRCPRRGHSASGKRSIAVRACCRRLRKSSADDPEGVSRTPGLGDPGSRRGRTRDDAADPDTGACRACSRFSLPRQEAIARLRRPVGRQTLDKVVGEPLKGQVHALDGTLLHVEDVVDGDA